MIDHWIRIALRLQQAALAVVRSHPRHVLAVVTAVLVGGTGATYAVASLAPDPSTIATHEVTETVQSLPTAEQIDQLAQQTQLLYRSEVTRSSDSGDSLLKRLGVFDPAAAAFIRADRLVQQNLLGRYGRYVTAQTLSTGQLQRLVGRWSPDDDGMFKRLTVQKTADGFTSALETLPMSASSRLASGNIASSLFAATDAAQIPDSVASQVAEIFSGDIDFHRALRKGDRFSVVYETLEGDGEPLRAGRVLSAEFVNAGKTHQAMWFQEPATSGAVAQSGATHALTKGGYYTLAGDSLHRAYLAAPLAFSRVTSVFSMRFHPILKLWRAHTGVDYGAPIGTPVRTVGDGVVEFAGVQNGYGNVIMIRHSVHDTTVYAHLSRINVQRGQNVTQGQTVGLVGQTGWATGPHLHFEFRVDGQFKDPLLVARQSQAVPVAAAARPLFDQAAQQVRAQLAAAASLQTGSTE